MSLDYFADCSPVRPWHTFRYYGLELSCNKDKPMFTETHCGDTTAVLVMAVRAAPIWGEDTGIHSVADTASETLSPRTVRLNFDENSGGTINSLNASFFSAAISPLPLP